MTTHEKVKTIMGIWNAFVKSIGGLSHLNLNTIHINKGGWRMYLQDHFKL